MLNISGVIVPLRLILCVGYVFKIGTWICLEMAGVSDMLAPSNGRGEGRINDNYTDRKCGIMFVNQLERSCYLNLAGKSNVALESNAKEDKQVFIIKLE